MGVLDPLGGIAVDALICGSDASRRCPPRGSLRSAGRGPVTVVVDREDDVRFTRTVLAAHDVVAGRVVVHPTVGNSGRLLWHDVLHAVADSRRPQAPARAASPVVRM